MSWPPSRLPARPRLFPACRRDGIGSPRVGLVDLHCHVLPGVDDGPSDLDDAVAMAEQAAADGISVICATPHVRHDHDTRIHELADRVAALNAALADRGVTTRVATGAEVAETALARLDSDELSQVSLGGTGRWVLLEPAPGPLGPLLLAAIGHLAERGARVVVAHPERHLGAGFEQVLGDCVAAGALVQLTAALVLDPGAGPTLAELARTGVAHLVASDAHSARAGRPVAIAAAIDALGEQVGENVARFAREAPAAILRGEEIEAQA